MDTGTTRSQVHPKPKGDEMKSEIIGLGEEVARYIKSAVDHEIELYTLNKQQEAIEALERFMKNYRDQQVQEFIQAREMIANRIVVEALGQAEGTSYLKIYLKEPENDTDEG